MTTWGLPDRAIVTPDEIASETCSSCNRLPLGYTGHNWNCRASGTKANHGQLACEKWIQMDDESNVIPINRSSPTTPPKDHMASLATLLAANPKVEKSPYRERPSGLRGHEGGVVYFIDCLVFTKIGFTSDWIEFRMKGIETHNPMKLFLWGLVAGTTADEKACHKDLAQFRYRNEWFRLNDEVRIIIREWITRNDGEVYDR